MLRNLAVLAAAAIAFALLPLAGASAQEEEVEDPHDACPEEPPEAPYTDRDEIPDVHVRNVDCVTERNIALGFPDGTFRPALPVPRDQMASFTARTIDEAEGTEELPEVGEQRFQDVPPGHTHYDNIQRLANAGIVEGGPGELSDDFYGPALPVRRDQVASFVLRSAAFALDRDLGDLQSSTQQFDDVPPTNVHFENINGAAEANLVLGGPGPFPPSMYGPDQATRRDQMASLMARLLQFLEREAEEPEPETPEETPEEPVEPAFPIVPFSEAPELIAASFGPTSADHFVVFYEFDEQILTAVDEFSFHIYGPVTDAQSADSVFAERRSGEPTQVRAVFEFETDTALWPSHTGDLELATTGTVEADAVEDADGNTNPEGAAGLNALDAEGETHRPDLVDIGDIDTRDATAADTPADQGTITAGTEYVVIEFDFDDDVTAANEGGFCVVYQDTATAADEECADGVNEDNSTVVAFFLAANVDEDDIRRAYVDETAIVEGDHLQAEDVAQNGTTSNPDLVEVNLNEEDDEVEFVFTTQVGAGTNPLDFFVYYLDGSVVQAADSEFEGTNTVTVEFPDGSINEAVTGAWVDFDAVRDVQGRENFPDEEGVQTTLPPMQVVAPVLVSITLEEVEPIIGPATFEAMFEFEKPLNDVPLTDAEFTLYDEEAEPIPVTGCTVEDDNEVHCTIATEAEFEDAEGGGVVFDAVENDTDDRNVDGREQPNYERSVPADRA